GRRVRSATSSRRRQSSWTRSSEPTWRGRASPTSGSATHGSARGWGRSSRRGGRAAGGAAPPRRGGGGRGAAGPPPGPARRAPARNGASGDSVARLLEFAGDEVEREYYYNDAGAQMEKFRESVEAVRRGEEPPEDGYRGDYVRDLAAEEGDPVPTMLAEIEAS